MLGSLSYVVLLVVGIGGLLRFRQLPLGLRYLVGVVWFGLAIELVSNLLRLQHHPNLFLYPFFLAGQVGLLALVYWWALPPARSTRAMLVVAGGYVVYALFSGVFAFELTHFKPGLQVGANLLLLGMVALYFRQLLQELRGVPLRRSAMFWVSVGLLVFCLGDLLIALFSDYVLTHYSKEFFDAMWDVHALLLIVLYLCYGLALWMHPRK